MANNNNQSTRVEDVLARIEQRERGRSLRKRLVMGTLAIGLIGGGAWGFSSFTGNSDSMKRVTYQEITEDRLQAMLTSNARGVLVEHPDLGTETIRSMADYQRIKETLLLARRLEEMQGKAVETDSAQILETYFLDIAGERRAGESLVFRIENYNPEVDYLLDLGNGQRRKIGEQLTYRYPLQGNFELQLLATRGEASSVYTKRFRIAAPLSPADGSQRSTEPQPEVPDQIAVTEEEAAAGTDTNSNKQAVASIEPMVADPNLLASNQAAPRELGATLRRSGQQASYGEVSRGGQEAAEGPIEAEKKRESSEAAIASPLFSSEVAPTFPGGEGEMMRFIQRNCRYPSSALKKKVEGKVVIRFVVNSDGSLSNYTIVKGIDEACDKEAMRIVQAMPNWVPGKQGGKRVPVYKTILITFRMINR